jgi:amino acid adenylation domain-containing protein/non-ribosomal peptide synthase protein (TIGR01720 family)
MKNVEDVYPLTPMQQGMLFHSLYAPNSEVYIDQASCRIQGELNVAAFRQAWQRVIDRHSVLRTAFIHQGLKESLQVVRQQVTLPWEDHDWRGLASAEQKSELDAFLRADRQRDFDLTQAPLMRMALLRLGDSDWQFVWSFHHMLLDGWCTSLLLQEVFHFYQGDEAVEIPQPRPYRDYIGWLQQQDLEAAKNYWQTKLRGFQKPTGLELQRPGRAQAANGYGQVQCYLPESSTRALESLAREQQVTVNTVVQGAWAVLLSRYSGERDVVYGVTVSGRPAELAGVEQMIGLFINTLPLRVNVADGAELGPWLQELQAEQAEMRQYEYSPLVEVQGWSEVERGVALFETLLAFENYPIAPISDGTKAAGGSLTVAQGQSTERTNYPLTLMIGPGEQLLLKVLYQEQYYDAEVIEKVLSHLEQILMSMAANGAQRVGELKMLSAVEEQQVREWNETSSEYARESCIHELFAEQVRVRPEAVAVSFAGEEVSYAELNERANHVAWQLQGVGVGPDVVVGICVERSIELVVGLLGILKAGGAYLPLDVDYPQERLEYMLTDAGVSVLLTQPELRQRLPVSEGLTCLELKRDWGSEKCPYRPQSKATAGTLAYVIYTSGSTGQPKGVAVPHRAVVRLVQPSNYVKLDETEVVLQLAPVSFDASTFELWGALLNGAKLVVMPAGRPSLDEIAEVIREEGVSTMWLTAGLFQVLATEQLASLREVKQLLAGGDVLGVGAVNAVLAEGAGAGAGAGAGVAGRVLINGYGPTENTTFSCCHVMQAGAEVEESVPIGKPITNSTTYVLDEELRPAPVGVRGELYVGGDGLARGYVGRAELTAEKFVPNPFSAEAGARLYRTGDVVRWNTAGVLEFIGRADQQVKVRGYRIELGEIEEALAGYEGLSESVVVVRSEGEGDKRLIGCVVAAEGVTIEVTELRHYLETKLPEYMVPGLFVELSSLPLTANGKVDRKALADTTLEFQGAGEYVAPRTAVEELLAVIWSEVLGVERVGAHDNFFELGGHSLLATQAISRVRETFKVEVPLRELFEAPQLSAFGEQVEKAMREEQQVEAPPIVPVSRERALPLSFSQQRLWFLDQLEPMSNAYNIPAVVRLRGPFTPEVFKQAVEEVMRRHESLRTYFVTEHGRARQEISEVTGLSVPVLDLTSYEAGDREREVRRLATAETRKPFDLTSGPLLRLTVLKLSEAEHVLLLVMHHIVSDGWSMGVLMRELTVLYDAFSRGEKSSLTELSIQYADYAIWQREWLQGEVLEQQMKYWRERLQGAPPVLELPTDHARPAVQTLRGAIAHRRLPAELLQQVNVLSRREGVTLYMSVLAAFVVMLSRYSGQHEIVVGTPIAGRTRQDVEGLIGFFVNTLVLRTSLVEQETVRQLLGRVRETCLGAYTHQDLPFEQLVDELQPERDLSHQPLFQVMYELEGGGDEQGWQMGDLEVEFEGVESEVAKFDLTLRVRQGQTGWELALEYKEDLFDESTVARMLEHIERVLAGMVSDVKQEVRTLPLLSSEEQQQLLEQWNATEREFDDVCVHQLFEARAAARGKAIALICEGEQISYEELNSRSNQLAHHLREIGVGPEVIVGLCLDRSIEMVVGMLAVLKAGGAYLPLDPSYPLQRISFMLDDAAPAILLTKDSLLGSLPPGSACVLRLDTDQHLFQNHSTENPESTTEPFNLAYMIYTSGSTGTPKGVQIHHRALANFLDSMKREPGLTADDYLLAVTSLSFDIAALEIFLPLICGARLEIVDREMAAQGDVLKERLIASHATVMQATPATWRLLAGAGIDGLEQVERWCGGEALGRELANYLASDGAVMWNLYGPTETTIWSGLWRVAPNTLAVLIGKPIANTQFYVLDDYLRLTPAGVPGELYIGGDGVGRGYLDRPDLTSEHFVPDPFSKTQGARMYRTGDIVKWKAGGELEYVERRDDQVKVRGYRIELGEIEALLNQHPAVKVSVAAVKEDDLGNKRLVAYLVEEPGTEVSARELREKIREQLPDYMVPSQLMKIEALPLTPNGKIDRKKLPALDGMALVLNEYVAPRSMSEAMLAEIWQRALGVERVGVNDNFFELGGDSIISIQIIALARERGFQFTPKELFQNQTIATLLEAIGSGAVVEAEQGLITGPVRLTPSQQWLFAQDLNEPEYFNQSLLLEVREQVDAEVLAEALQRVVLHHDALRLRFNRSESGWTQYHADPTERVDFTRVDLSHLPTAERRAAIEAKVAETNSGFDLNGGSLLRVVYFDMGQHEAARLLLVAHHLVIDGLSWRILLADLQQVYRLLTAGEEVQLSLKSTSYQQWSEAIATYAASLAIEEQQAYWLESGREQVQRLPHDFAGQENLVGNTSVLTVSLGQAETETLLHDIPAVYYTQIGEVLLSALAVALKQWSGQRLLLIDMEGHGRDPVSERTDVSRTVGWFTTVYPVFLELPGGESEVVEALKHVKEQMRRIPEQGLGYGLLRYQGSESKQESLRELPQAEVLFNYSGQFDQTFSESGMFVMAQEERGSGRSSRNQRQHLLEITGAVLDGQLQLTWIYNQQIHTEETVERLAADFVAALGKLIEQCQWGELAGFTPSDFPEAELSQQELDELVAELS